MNDYASKPGCISKPREALFWLFVAVCCWLTIAGVLYLVKAREAQLAVPSAPTGLRIVPSQK